MGHWWKYTDRTQLEHQKNTLPSSHLSKALYGMPGIEPQPPNCKTGNSPPQTFHNPVKYVQVHEVVNIYTGLSKN